MRIVQITDLHLPDTDEDARGVDTWKNLENSLFMALSYAPDMLVFTGDICFNKPKDSIYRKFHDKIAAIPVPMRFLAGNHDRISAINHIINFRNDMDAYPIEYLDDCDILYINTPTATVKKEIYSIIDKECHKGSQKPFLIFMHHPPVEMGLTYMDKNHPFKEPVKFCNSLASANRQTFIFCGHYHNERQLHLSDFHLFCTPSIYIQIDEKYDTFKPLMYDAGIRIIDINEEKLSTFVRYTDGASTD